MRGCCVKNDERRVERSSGRNDGHAGRLIRKLALVFLAFAVVAVVLNCALAYVSTRDTFLQSEAYRLGQVGGYAANATPQALPSDALQAWKDNADELDPATTYDQSLAETQGLISAYNAEVDRLKGSEEEATEEDQDRLDGMLAEYERKSIPLSLYSLDAMLDRLRASFSVSRLAVVVPDEQNETVLYVAEGISGDQKRGVDAHFFGDEEQRLKADYPALWEAVETGEPSTDPALAPDGETYAMYVPFAVDGQTWVYEVSMGTDELEAAVRSQVASTVVVSFAVFAVCLTAMLLLLRRTLVKPLVALSSQVRDYAASKSAAVADVIRSQCYPKDEVGDLAASTADMIDELQAHMDDIARMGAERERARSELAVASRIQLSALPTVRPPFSGCDDFGLSASMHPAKEVGGDFYDFFLIDQDHCGVVIADVSGKGVPAALFMMRVKALLNQLLREDLSPDQVLARANDGLCEDNEAGMFVTVWLGVLDLRSGKLVYANGGHNPPLYRHADGSVEWMRDRSGLLLGSFEGVPYRVFERTIDPGRLPDPVHRRSDRGHGCVGSLLRRRTLVPAGGAGVRRIPGIRVGRYRGGRARLCGRGRSGRRHHAAGAALRWTGKRPRGVGGRESRVTMDVNIAVDYFGGEAVLKLGGHLNTNTAADLEEALEPVFERTNKVVLDFADLEYLSSAGLRVLVATQKRVTAAEGALRIVNASDDIREVFDITGLIDVFDVE